MSTPTFASVFSEMDPQRRAGECPVVGIRVSCMVQVGRKFDQEVLGHLIKWL